MRHGGDVTVIIPNARAAARWNGALAARLRHAPLEAFMRSRGRRWLPGGQTRVTDNVAAATLVLVESACGGPGFTPSAGEYPALARLACAVSLGVSSLICEPTTWRIAALVATARLLTPFMGLDPAAHLAAAAARDFSRKTSSGSQDADMLQLGILVAAAVGENDPTRLAELDVLMQRTLSQARLSAAGARSMAAV